MPQAQLNSTSASRKTGDFSLRVLVIVAALTVTAFLIMGYHPGLEDDSFYLAAIKHDLNPALFPHDADFFRVQFQATIFDKMIALSVLLTHVPLAWIALFWQIAAVFFVIHGCCRISRRCFSPPQAQWAATAVMAALLTLPLPGIAITIADQYLHPRNIATAAILAAVVAVIDNKPRWAGVLLLFALCTHVIMASFGLSFCVFLWWHLRGRRVQNGALSAAVLLIPLAWIFEPASDAWRQAAYTRDFYFLGRWHWYEWIGVFAPLVILYVIRRFLPPSSDHRTLCALLSATLGYGIFQTIVGILVMLPPSLERLRPFEPMRYLQLLYIMFFLIVGGLLGRYVLTRSTVRWALLFLPLSGGMLYAQRQMYSGSRHLEMPWTAPTKSWVQAFAWIRSNTPVDSLFALDPHYEALPGEDYHGFRALAERSALADYEKDAGMAARVPELAPRWHREVTALNGWREFQDSDFQRLKKELNVNWIVLSRADNQYSIQDSPTISCPYQNRDVKVCRLD